MSRARTVTRDTVTGGFSEYYKNYKIIRTLVLYGSLCEEIIDIEVGFLLNEKGKMILGIKAPKIFIQSLENLLAFWKPQ